MEKPLPPPVEELIQKICVSQNQPPLSEKSRSELYSIGEETALRVLKEIHGGVKIRVSFDGLLIKMIERYNLSHQCSPQKRPRLSPQVQNPNPISPVKCDPAENRTPNGCRTVRLMMESPLPSSFPMLEEEKFQVPPSYFPIPEEEGRFSPQLVGLGEIEFRKAFLILNYIGSKKLEEAISAELIRELKNLSMVDFEAKLWNHLGQNNVNISDRCQLEWESTKTYLYHCHVSSDGSLRFKGPFLDATKTHLQRVLGDDSVLIVKFTEDASERKSSASGQYSPEFKRVLKEGIPLGLRRYRFFVFKDGGKEARKKNQSTSSVRSVFVRMESEATIDRNQDYLLNGKTVREARNMFMHVDTVPNLAKYMARLSLILSKTVKLEIDLAGVKVREIEDICCEDANGDTIYDKGDKKCIHTDGTGFISADLAVQCPKNVFHGSYDKENAEMTISEMILDVSRYMETPLLIQVRLYNNGLAAKGTLLVNKQLEKCIQLRDSMIKVRPDPNSNICTKNSLEVVTTSNRPRRVSLSRYLIALLNYGGVPEDFFMGILKSSLEDVQRVFSNKRAALRVSLNYGSMDELNAARMILSGIPLDEAFLQHQLFKMSNEERNGLKAGKLPVNDCYYLMGTADPTGILEKNEVCIILDNGQISGKVLVYRHPGLHFGDIHILNAKYVKEMEDIVGHAKYGIFFPSKGPRSVSDEMGGGDLDGDMYFVSKNSQLLHYYKELSPRWISNSSPLSTSGPNKKPCELSDDELEEELSNLLLRCTFQPSYAMSVAADSWMAIMDRYLTMNDCSSSATEVALMENNNGRLIDIYYDALDAPKSGAKVEVPKELKAIVFPHYMEKENPFTSTSILGKIDDCVKSYGEEDFSAKEIQKLPCFEVDTPVVEHFKGKWRELYKEYRADMASALERNTYGEMNAANDVIGKYKEFLYGAEGFGGSKKPKKEIHDEAVALYNVTYDHAIEWNDVKKCGFAWKVAGPALCDLYACQSASRDELLPCVPSVLKELFS